MCEKKEWSPKRITLPRGALLSGTRGTLRHIEGRCTTLQPPLWSMCFNQSIVFLSTKLLAAQWVGPPSLGSGFCQLSVFCSYFRGKALHLVLGRQGNFPLKCFPSLSRAPCLRYIPFGNLQLARFIFAQGTYFVLHGLAFFSSTKTPVPCLSWQREKNAVCFHITFGLTTQQVKRSDKYTC